MARKAVPLRLEPALIEEIDALAKATMTPRTYIIEEAIKSHLHRLRNYVAMDTAPPKTVPLALCRKVKSATLKPGGVTYVEPDPILADLKMKPGKLKDAAPRAPSPARSVRGYAIDGSPIYR